MLPTQHTGPSGEHLLLQLPGLRQIALRVQRCSEIVHRLQRFRILLAQHTEAYRQHLQQFVYRSGTIMKPIFTAARACDASRKRIVFAEGEEERILRAVQIIVDEKLARPILIGRPEVIQARIAKFGLRLTAEVDFTMVNTEHDPRYRDYWQTYHAMMARKAKLGLATMCIGAGQGIATIFEAI